MELSSTEALEVLYDEERIPMDTIQGIVEYIENRITPGGFLEAVLSNDLKETYARADNNNLFAIPAIVHYLYNRAPLACWGSPEKVEKWLIGHAKND